ncbi:MAG: peptidase C1 [Candidatus Aminicenantes bacterium RBG_13_63_10]|nr:MAG: peptidase C1 [Candidatus Aminicenantes bacterium RBG_13_63_10]
MKKFGVLILAVSLISLATLAQETKKDKGIFVEPKNPFWEEIQKSTGEFGKPKKEASKAFIVDLSGYDAPKSLVGFQAAWHNPPVSQGNTSTCWCFSTVSMFESEVYRLYGKKVRISEAFTVYCEYLERARRFVRERGRSAVAEGSEANAVTREWKLYGCMPWEAYSGLQPGQKFHDHSKLIGEVKAYLSSLQSANAWDEGQAVQTVKAILNHHLGTPPETFVVEGKTYTPRQYLKDYLKIDPDDYVDVLSYMQQPFGTRVEYEVPDNWWHSPDYYNIPLDVFMKILKSALARGFTVSIGGDVSEPGRNSQKKACMIPTFDIPSAFIDDSARQYRFGNGSTTDDHGVHLIGCGQAGGTFWFVTKDSAASAFNADPKGYYFLTEDYLKLKMMDFMVHKDAVKGFIEVK